MKKIMEYLKLMRVHHYIKNLLVFTALICSRQIFNVYKLSSCLLGFISFCMISSSIYIINDIRDVDEDRKHEKKAKRPIASGKVSIKEAKILSFVLFFLSFVISILIPVAGKEYCIVLFIYFIINIVYSSGAKDVPIVDVALLSSGFYMRVLYGALITDIKISNWLYLTVITMSLFFALGKRRNELINDEGKCVRKVLKSYTKEFLDKNMYMCLGLANCFYSLWSMDSETIVFRNAEYLIYTIPLVILISMTYSYSIENTSDGDPVSVLLHSKSLISLTLIYAIVMFWILYF